jgi:hypothetical protein
MTPPSHRTYGTRSNCCGHCAQAEIRTAKYSGRKETTTDVDGAKRQAYWAHAEMFLLPYVTLMSLMHAWTTPYLNFGPRIHTRLQLMSCTAGYVREVPVVLYKTRHPNESSAFHAMEAQRRLSSGQLYEGPKSLIVTRSQIFQHRSDPFVPVQIVDRL